MRKTSIGGQAVIEGVMMQGKSSTAIAVRDSDKIIRLETKRIKPVKERSIFFRIPVIRGMLMFALTLVNGVKTMMKSAEVFGEAEPSKFEKWLSRKFKLDLMSVITTISLIIGLGLAVVIFIILPNLMLDWFKVPKDTQALWGGVIKIGILFLYLILVSLIKDIRRTFQYHGAEHKTINCYERELPLTVENVKQCSKLHNRCGTTFLFFVILVSVGVALLVDYIIPQLKEETALRIVARIVTLPLVAGLAYELLKFLALIAKPPKREKKGFGYGLLNIVMWILFLVLFPLRIPGLLLQFITTQKPDDKMIEVAITSFTAVLKMDENPDVKEVKFPLQKKYEDVRKEMETKLSDAGITEQADLDWILCSVLKRRRNELSKASVVSVKQYDTITKLVEERCTNKPVQYVLSETDFYGYTVKLNSDVLIPRFETELLCEQAIKRAKENSTVLDLCSGSGAIAIAIQKETKAKVKASDISEKALELAKENAKMNEAEIEFIKSDMFENISGKFDIIISNPPYVKTADIETLPKEVKDFEPHLALDGGEDGLKFYRIIAERASGYLNAKGMLLLECGLGQAQDIKAMLDKEFNVSILKDYDKIDRIIKACLKN